MTARELRIAGIWFRLAQIYTGHPKLAGFRPSCECCAEIVVERHYGGAAAAAAWAEVKALRVEAAELAVA